MKTEILEKCAYMSNYYDFKAQWSNAKRIPLSVKTVGKVLPTPSPTFKFLWYEVAQSQERT